MSGGRMNYICYLVEEAAPEMGDRELIALVKDVAQLLHDREWYLSGDYRIEDWNKSKKAFKQKWFKDSREDRLKALVEETFEQAKMECFWMIGCEEETEE